MAWYDMKTTKSAYNSMAAPKTDKPKISQESEDELGLTMGTNDDAETVAVECSNDWMKMAPKTDYSKYNSMAGAQKSDNQPSEGAQKDAQEIFNAIGTTFSASQSKTGIKTIDFMSILHGIQTYARTNNDRSALGKFYGVIYNTLEEMGVEIQSDEAALYIKELIKNISNADKDETKLSSNGIKLNIDKLTGLDKNNDGSFFDELEIAAQNAKIPAQKAITESQIEKEMDADGDGMITYDELEKALENGSEYAKLFVGEDGIIDKALFYALNGNRNKFSAYQMRQWLDINGDGIITKEEIEKFKTEPQPDWNTPKRNDGYIPMCNPYQDALLFIKQTSIYKPETYDGSYFKFK